MTKDGDEPVEIELPPLPPPGQPIRFFLHNGFWEIWLDGCAVKTRWGSDAGETPRTRDSSFSSADEAERDMIEQIRDNLKAGFRVDSPELAAERKRLREEEAARAAEKKARKARRKRAERARESARSNPALEQEIVAAPDNPEPYLVYADFLQQNDDVLGELIALQVRGDDQSLRNADELIADESAELFGPLAKYVDHTGFFTLEWKYGFLYSVRISEQQGASEVLRDHPEEDEDYDPAADPGITWFTKQLLALTIARLLRKLTIGLTEWDEEPSYAGVLKALAKAPPAALEELFIGDFTREEREVSWVELGNFGPVWKHLPRLRALILHAGKLDLGTIVAPQLESFEVRTGGLTRDNLTSLTTARWPKLRRLMIWFGSGSYGAEASISDLGPILDGKKTPGLTELGLMNAELTDELCQQLHAAPILPKLEVLDLSLGTMSDHGAEALIAHASSYAHLRLLNVEDNYLTPAIESRLQAAIPAVRLGAQREANGGARYVSVGE